jgi:hypothetical protein
LGGPGIVFPGRFTGVVKLVSMMLGYSFGWRLAVVAGFLGGEGGIPGAVVVVAALGAVDRLVNIPLL